MTRSEPSSPTNLREGVGCACDEERCLTLDGAFERVKQTFLRNHPDGDVTLLVRAYKAGRAAHANQRRKSGEPYFFHPLAVAQSLAEWRLDAVSIACGLLHDTVEDTLLQQEDIRKQFGEEMSEIVDGLTKMSKLEFTDRTLLNAENVRKLLVAMGKDVRVLLVKLADRLHNMRTLDSMREEKQRRIARETLELYAPLANRLGMGMVRAELEDLSFRRLEPQRYEEMLRALSDKNEKSRRIIEEIERSLVSAMKAHGLQVRIYGRAKTLYGIWRKMGIQEKALEDIHDWMAYRIICPDRASCYTAMGLVHAIYKPVPGRFKDYISLPKDNGYQSIHTTVLMPTGDSFEVQIRTDEMHEAAEAGIAAHWTYKEGRISNRQEINQAAFLRRMVELHQDARDSRDLVANLKGELSFGRIQVFTPKGDLRSLVEGATPIDFAYAIHTEVGHRCVGAKVNGRMVALKHELHNGDQVEILTRADHKPSRDWLSVVKSATAKSRIQAFIREEERRHAMTMGRERLEREARASGVRLDDAKVAEVLDARLHELKFTNWESFHVAVGFNRITVHKLLEPLLPESQKQRGGDKAPTLTDDTVLVDDNVGVLFILAQCCKPIWGDDIVDYTTRGRGISIHRVNCPQLASAAMNPERRVSVAWGNAGRSIFDTEIALTALDVPGVVSAVTEAISHEGVHMQRFNAASAEGGVVTIHVALRVKDRNQIVAVMSRLRQVKGVNTVERVRGSIFGSLR